MFLIMQHDVSACKIKSKGIKVAVRGGSVKREREREREGKLRERRKTLDANRFISFTFNQNEDKECNYSKKERMRKKNIQII